MSRRRRRPVAPWIVIGVLAIVVVAFGYAFVHRLLHPPVSPFVEGPDGATSTVIQCDVVNASGTDGAGRQIMAYLRERGFDVVELSTATERQRRTVVLDRLGDRPSAIALARCLGLPDSLVESRIDSMLFVRASVVLGSDVRTLAPFQE